MAYWVHGRDSETGRPMSLHFPRSTQTSAEAVAEAEQMGMEVTSVEFVPPLLKRMTFSGRETEQRYVVYRLAVFLVYFFRGLSVLLLVFSCTLPPFIYSVNQNPFFPGQMTLLQYLTYAAPGVVAASALLAMGELLRLLLAIEWNTRQRRGTAKRRRRKSSRRGDTKTFPTRPDEEETAPFDVRKRKVSLWLGDFTEEGSLANYLQTNFAFDFGFHLDDMDKLEIDASPTPKPVTELLHGFSYHESFEWKATAAAENAGWTNAHCAVLYYDSEGTSTPVIHPSNSSRLKFIGTFQYQSNE